VTIVAHHESHILAHDVALSLAVTQLREQVEQVIPWVANAKVKESSRFNKRSLFCARVTLNPFLCPCLASSWAKSLAAWGRWNQWNLAAYLDSVKKRTASKV
jgi:hypothetical protein